MFIDNGSRYGSSWNHDAFLFHFYASKQALMLHYSTTIDHLVRSLATTQAKVRNYIKHASPELACNHDELIALFLQHNSGERHGSNGLIRELRRPSLRTLRSTSTFQAKLKSHKESHGRQEEVERCMGHQHSTSIFLVVKSLCKRRVPLQIRPGALSRPMKLVLSSSEVIPRVLFHSTNHHTWRSQERHDVALLAQRVYLFEDLEEG